jgi:hypothetical protein
MTRTPLAFGLLVWLTLVASVFVWTLTSYEGLSDTQLKNEVILRHVLTMLLLTPPSGWLLSSVVSAVTSVADLTVEGLGYAVLVTLTCGVAGYLQWLVLLPWLWRRWKARLTQNNAPS